MSKNSISGVPAPPAPRAGDRPRLGRPQRAQRGDHLPGSVPDPFVRGMDPDPDPSVIVQK